MEEPPHAEIVPSNVGVVKKNNALAGELGQPGLKVVLHSVIGMKSVNVQ